MTQKNLVQKAVCTLVSCLEVTKIPHTVGPGKIPTTITVHTRGGRGFVECEVVLSKYVESNRFQILASEIASSHRPTANAAFHSLTMLAGYGTPIAIDRG